VENDDVTNKALLEGREKKKIGGEKSTSAPVSRKTAHTTLENRSRNITCEKTGLITCHSQGKTKETRDGSGLPQTSVQRQTNEKKRTTGWGGERVSSAVNDANLSAFIVRDPAHTIGKAKKGTKGHAKGGEKKRGKVGPLSETLNCSYGHWAQRTK